MDKPPRAAFPLRHAIANIFVETGGVPGFDFDSVQGTRHGNIQHVKKTPPPHPPFFAKRHGSAFHPDHAGL